MRFARSTVIVVCAVASFVALAGVYVAAKAYHQTHTPLPLVIIQGEDR